MQANEHKMRVLILGAGGVARAMAALAARLERVARASGGEVVTCRTAAEIRTGIAAGKLTAVLHIEGAEAIDPV